MGAPARSPRGSFADGAALVRARACQESAQSTGPGVSGKPELASERAELPAHAANTTSPMLLRPLPTDEAPDQSRAEQEAAPRRAPWAARTRERRAQRQRTRTARDASAGRRAQPGLSRAAGDAVEHGPDEGDAGAAVAEPPPKRARGRP